MFPYASRARRYEKRKSPTSDASVFGLLSCTLQPSGKPAHSDASLRSRAMEMASAMAA